MHYPLMLNIEGCKCLVIGAGDVGRRKATEVLISGAVVSFIDLKPEDDGFWMDLSLRTGLETEELHHRVTYLNKVFEDTDLDDMTICFATTSDRTLNGHVAEQCKIRRILANIADNPSEGSFIVPSIRRAEPITVAVYSDDNPAASRFLADRFVRQLNVEFRRFIAHTHMIRKRMKVMDVPSKLRQKVMKAIYQDGPADMAMRNESDIDAAISQADVMVKHILEE